MALPPPTVDTPPAEAWAHGGTPRASAGADEDAAIPRVFHLRRWCRALSPRAQERQTQPAKRAHTEGSDADQLKSRRVLLAAMVTALGAVTAACTRAENPSSGQGPSADARPTPSQTPTASPTPTRSPKISLPPVTKYVVMGDEVEPGCKQAAVDYLQTALTVPVPTSRAASPAPDVATRMLALGLDPQPAQALLAMLPAGASSAVEVVYPQYGGLTSTLTQASVMLVANQYRATTDRPETETISSTFDVRLRRTATTAWQITDVLPAAPAAPPEGIVLSPSAQSVLAHEGIVLPGAARADLLSGSIDDRVSQALLTLAQQWRLHVQVIRSGHPINVFATDRVSNHTRGRAVDIWSIDDVPVIDHTASAWRELMKAALQVSREVGGPQKIGSGSFTDHVHQDHVHVGFD